MEALWVAGFPSLYGGADTELDHTIDLLRGFDVEVHLVPMFSAETAMRDSVNARGCHIHDYRPEIFQDKIVASWCNGEFLAALPEIMAAGPPGRVIWFNCMTWNFDKELNAHRERWIDYHGFVSEYQLMQLMRPLAEISPVLTFPYRPYFNSERVSWRYREWNGEYRLGRISRDDADKFAADTWQIFDRVLVPHDVAKKVYILGFGENAKGRIGEPPGSLDFLTWAPGVISAEEFYRTIDTMIHKTGGSRESYSRVLVEAYAHGVVPIVERDYAFPELVIHGETGFMAQSSDEMSWYASMLAHNPLEHRRLAENGRLHLQELTRPEVCILGWKKVLRPLQ